MKFRGPLIVAISVATLLGVTPTFGGFGLSAAALVTIPRAAWAGTAGAHGEDREPRRLSGIGPVVTAAVAAPEKPRPAR
jgi:hypothetical protein